MARDLVVTTDIIAGEGHELGYPDTKNQYLREIWADYKEEHEITGAQKAPYDEFAIWEPYTYTGSGAIQTIAWQNTTLTDVLQIFIWSEDDGELYITHAAGRTQEANSGDLLTNAVTAFDTDGMTLGIGTECNTNTTTYYYLVFAMGTTPDAGSNASPPSWIADSTACLGGAASTMANDVEDDLDTKFLTNHTIDTGVHDDSEFDDLMKTEGGSFTPDGTVQTITLDNANLAVNSFWVATRTVGFTGTGFTRLREYTNSALTASGFVIVGTGEITVDTSKMRTSATTILDINSDTTDGDNVIVDSSAYALPIQNPLGSAATTVTHSTTYANTGASSLKFINGAASCLVRLGGLVETIPLLGDFDIQFELLLPAAAATCTGNVFAYLSTNSNTGARIQIAVEIVSGDHIVQANIRDANGTETELQSTTDLDDTAFHHISLSRTGGLLDLQVDASSEDSAIFTGSLGTAMQFYIGRFGVSTVITGEVPTVDDGTAWYMDDIQVDVTLPYFDQSQAAYYLAIGED